MEEKKNFEEVKERSINSRKVIIKNKGEILKEEEIPIVFSDLMMYDVEESKGTLTDYKFKVKGERTCKNKEK